MDILKQIESILKEGDKIEVAIIFFAVLITLFKDYLWSVIRDPNKIFQYKTKNNIIIGEIIQGVCNWMRSNRSVIWEFWNSKETMGGFPLQYMGVTCEKTDENTKKVAYLLKEINTSEFSETLLMLLPADVRYKIFHDSDIDIPEDLRVMMAQFAVRSVVMFKLHPNHLMYGTIAINFLHDYYSNPEVEYRPRELTEKEYTYLEIAAKRVLKLKSKPNWWSIIKTPKRVNVWER